jgi:hypothetical protein
MKGWNLLPRKPHFSYRLHCLKLQRAILNSMKHTETNNHCICVELWNILSSIQWVFYYKIRRLTIISKSLQHPFHLRQNVSTIQGKSTHLCEQNFLISVSRLYTPSLIVNFLCLFSFNRKKKEIIHLSAVVCLRGRCQETLISCSFI